MSLFRRECDSALEEWLFISELTLLAQLWERRSVTAVNPLSNLTKVHARSDIRKMAEHLTPQKKKENKGGWGEAAAILLMCLWLGVL